VEAFFKSEKPEYVFLAAARVGGILANNTYPAEFIYENLMIQTNVIHAAYKAGVKKLLFLGSSCIYPRECPQPMKEDYLLSGKLEPTNEPYAVAKIAGIKMVESYNRQYGTNYVSVMPTNAYGPGDNFDLAACHVFPALIRKFHEAKLRGAKPLEVGGLPAFGEPTTFVGGARGDQGWRLEAENKNDGGMRLEVGGKDVLASNLKARTGRSSNLTQRNSALLNRSGPKASSEAERGSPQTSDDSFVTIWGSGKARREFLYVDDLADACLFIMLHYSGSEVLNIGVGKDISIGELANLIKEIVGFQGEVRYDASKPDGTPQKLLDVIKLRALGWQSKTSLREGINKTYRWYVQNAEVRSQNPGDRSEEKG
jgi:GDP-L-fucose synthase